MAEEQYGDALLSSLPMRIVKMGALRRPRPRGMKLERRGALWAVGRGGGVELQVINTHLGLVPLEQRGQMACLTGHDWLGHEDCARPVVMLGDFSATRATPPTARRRPS